MVFKRLQALAHQFLSFYFGSEFMFGQDECHCWLWNVQITIWPYISSCYSFMFYIISPAILPLILLGLYSLVLWILVALYSAIPILNLVTQCIHWLMTARPIDTWIVFFIPKKRCPWESRKKLECKTNRITKFLDFKFQTQWNL